ncbi:MAG: T9SS type A sorting domain-containing protein [Saprospiraceae bacterium]|nr:T9SS type A sorting domain-containing protein [Saprospiraceae bacterium]MBK9631396.1 T9SS type A sorting domain-containing protein [Saprospiraceae bacterium]
MCQSKFDSSYAVACTVIPAYNLGKRPFGLTTTTQWYAFSQWTTNGNLDYDIAIMRLAQPIGNTTGWINLSYQSDTSFFTSPSNDFYSFGYPAAHPLGTPVFEGGERMYYMNGFMDFWRTDKTICHYNIGYGGQSGSGLFHQDSFNIRRAYAVLSHGNLFPPYHTCHCRMDSSMFLYFNQIIAQSTETETQNSARQFLIYPNPTGGIFQIDFIEGLFEEIQIQLFDLLGRLVINEKLQSSQTKSTINMSSFPSGTYYIKICINGKSYVQRICKAE